MAITLDISDAHLEAQLRERARREGVSAEEYARRLVLTAVQSPMYDPDDDPLTPFRRQVDRSGMDDEQLEAFLGNLIEKRRSGRRTDDA